MLQFFTNDFIYVYFLITYILNNIVNHIIKTILKIPRPKGAKNCSSVITKNDILSKTYGMPSGHSQIIGFIIGFWIFYIIDKYNQYSLKNKIGFLIILLLLIYICISRILIGCHTINQVIVGYIIGLLFGISCYKIYQLYDNKLISKIKYSLVI